MSELQEKLAKRRSQLTGMGLTPPAAPTEPAVTPAPVEASTHSSPDNWRDTPSVKLAEHMNMVEENEPATAESPQAQESEENTRDVGLAATLKQLDEKIRDSTDEGRPSVDSLSGKLDSIDDFLGGELNEGLEKLTLNSKFGNDNGSGFLRSKGVPPPPSASTSTSGGDGLFDDDGKGDMSRLQDTILSLQSALQEKDDLIGSLQVEVQRLRDSQGNDDSAVLHNLRESESDPFDAHIGVGRRRGGVPTLDDRRPSFLTRDRINSFSSSRLAGGGGRRRASSAVEFRAPFDSPEKMKDMFHLLLEDDAGSGVGATTGVKLDPGAEAGVSTNDNGKAAVTTGKVGDEALFGARGRDKDAALKSTYDPSVVSLGGFDLNTKSLSASSSSSSSYSSSSAAQAVDDLLGEGGGMFKDVKSPVPQEGDKNQREGGLFSALDQGERERLTSQGGPLPAGAKITNEMSYMDFVDRLSEPENEDLAHTIKRFLLSVLGPRGDGTAPSIFQDKEMDYTFHGTTNLEKRVADFYSAMDSHFRKHSAWQGLNDEQYVGVIDCLERHILSMIHDLAYQTVLEDTEEDDKALAERIELLQFLPPDALDIPVDLQNEVVWAVAGNELRKINVFKTPGEKINCIIACAALITRTLGVVKLRAGQSPDAGADEFLPLFIWVVLKAKVPHLYRNAEYISAFHQPTRLMGMDGYCLMNLRSSLEFIKGLDSDSVTLNKKEFDNGIEAARAKQALEVAAPPSEE